MLDWRGTPIVKGSIVVYPGRHRSHLWMMEGRVVELTTIETWQESIPALLVQPLRQGRYGRTNMRPVRITAIERVTVIPKCDTGPTDREVAKAAILSGGLDD